MNTTTDPYGRPVWFCGCGTVGADKRRCLRDILNAFSGATSSGDPYVNLDDMRKVHKKYSTAAVELILYMLDDSGYAEHSGSVGCSQWLTEEGIKLREWANKDKVDDDKEMDWGLYGRGD